MTNEDPEVSTFEWTPPGTIPEAEADGPCHAVGDLADEILSTVENRGLTAADLVRKVARDAADWMNAAECPDAGVGATLLGHEFGLLREAHGWRGPVARFLGALEKIKAQVTDDGSPALREALSAECANWQEGSSDRLPDRGRCAAGLLDPDPITGAAGLEAGETLLVHGWSETVARGIELAQARGIGVDVLVSEGGPDLGGRRMARRLVASGLNVRFIYDAALVDAVKRVDRVWLGTESIGHHDFVARVGTHALLERAQELDVPSAVLATVDKVAPGGQVELPTWSADEPWHLWEGAPHGVTVEAQSFELVPLDLVSSFATNEGVLGALELANFVRKGAPATSPVGA